MTSNITVQNFGMFTDAGNIAVARIVENNVRLVNTFNTEHAFRVIVKQLELLSNVASFSEAIDTEVRECVWNTLNKSS